MIDKLIIWMQFVAASLLAADAFIPEDRLKQLNSLIKDSTKTSNAIYIKNQIRGDAISLAIFFGVVAADILVWKGDFATDRFFEQRYMWGTALIFVIWFSLVQLGLILFLASVAPKRLGSALRIFLRLPIYGILSNTPKGPVYTAGFFLMVFSYLFLLLNTYGALA